MNTNQKIEIKGILEGIPFTINVTQKEAEALSILKKSKYDTIKYYKKITKFISRENNTKI